MAIYYVWSGAVGSNNGSSWTNAYTTITAAFVPEVAGDTLYVAHDHAESSAAAVTLTSSGTVSAPTKIVCVNRAGSVPPVSADRRATATVTTTGAVNITFNGCSHYDGIIFTSGAAIAVATIASNWHRLDNCSLRLANAAGNSITFTNAAASGNYVELNNTTVSFGATGQGLAVYNRFTWRNTPSALLGTIPSTLFTISASRGNSVECIGVDFSAAGSGKALVGSTGGASQSGTYTFVDCKLNASVARSSVGSAFGTTNVDFIRSSATGNVAVYSQRGNGTLIEETTIVRTGGASDGTTLIAWRVDTHSTNCHYSLPFECPAIAIWNDTVGSSVTAAVEGIWGGGAVPNDDDVWLDVEYLGDASSPQGSFVNDGKADLLTTAAGQATSSETWGGSTTKFKLNVSFTAQQKGWIYARVKCAKASSTFYIDPLVTLT